MEDPDAELRQRLILAIEQLFQNKRLPPVEARVDLELTMPQMRVLMFLTQGPRRVGELAAHLGTTMPSTTTMIDRLVAKGVVERFRDAEDRRVVTCGLTEVGTEEVERFWRIRHLALDRMASHLSHEELETVIRAMEVIGAAIRRSEQGSSDSSADNPQEE